MIKGRERIIYSEDISVAISGRPLAMVGFLERDQGFGLGQDARLEVAFCSDPRPRAVRWEWGSLRSALTLHCRCC